MTTHETDQPQEIDHADENYGVDSEGDELAQEQAAEAQEAEPVDDDQLDHTDPPQDLDPEASEADADADASDDGIDTDGLADPDAGMTDEAVAFDDETDDDTDDEQAIALGPIEAAPAGEYGDDDDTPVEPTIVELDETELEVLDDTEPTDDDLDGDDLDDGDDDESVLLTESTPGSVLPPEGSEEPDELDEPVAVEAPEDLPVAPSSPESLLEPADPDSPLDPGTGTYQERWSVIQGGFVDDPHRTVESAGALVTQMWQELERAIAEQRAALDDGWSDGSSTDDLRTAFRAYRDMFNRLTDLLAETQPSG